MKNLLTLVAIAILAVSAHAQLALTTPVNTNESFGQGVYYAPAYNYVMRVISGGATAGGTYSIQVPAAITLPDGRRVAIFANSTFPPIVIGQGSTLETVTPSSSSGCNVVNQGVGNGINPGAPGLCTLTATFSNAHGAGDIVQSGDLGIQEAINDAGNNGGGMVYWVIPSGGANKTDLIPSIVTLSTSGANTNMSAIKIPTRSTVMGATGIVTTTIGTCAGGWSFGYSSGTEFSAANTTLTAGTTTDSSTLQPAVAMNATAAVPIAHCTTSNASAGAMRAVFYGYKHAPSTF